MIIHFTWRHAAAALLVPLVLALTACSSGVNSSVSNNNSLSNSANSTLLNEAIQATGFKPLVASEEMHNLLMRIQRQNDPNHISYVYFFINGIPYPVKHYVIRGKCSSTDSQAVNPDQPINDSNGNPNGGTISASQLDGSFGTNEQGIFCFVNDAARTMVTWSGPFFQSDQVTTFPNTPIRIDTSATFKP